MENTCMILFFLLIINSLVFSQDEKANYNVSEVPAYAIPDPLIMTDDTQVKDKETWLNKRRPEIIDLFEKMFMVDHPGSRIVFYLKVHQLIKMLSMVKQHEKKYRYIFQKKGKI
jgi:hypothetical protein